MTSLPPPTPDSSAAPAAAVPVRRPRYQPRPTTRWQRIPVSLKIGAPVLLLAGAWFGYRQWRASHAILEFVAVAEQATVPSLELTFFPDELHFTSPSPAPAIGSARTEGSSGIAVGDDLVPGTALVRWRGAGVGTGYARVHRGRTNEPIHLAPPGVVAGRVGTPRGFFCLGLRTLGLEAVGGARVIGLGGGDHGVPLCEATTDAEGRFRLEGFAADVANLGIRVLAKGHAIASVSWSDGRVDPIVALVPTEPIAGNVALPPTVKADGLRLLAKGLPGVDCEFAADGSFTLDHVPPGLEPRLLVYGLPAGFTHALVHAMPGDRNVRIQVVRAARLRGRVVDRQTQMPLGGAMVWHDHGPGGSVSCDTDVDGAFELTLTPPGEVVLRAQHTIEAPLGESETLTAEKRIVVEEGKDIEGIVLRVD